MSRGVAILRVKSTLAPFRRAGIYFPTTAEAIDIDLADLDGARFLALASDPALAASLKRDDGDFTRLPVIDGSVTADQAQMMIDAILTGDVDFSLAQRGAAGPADLASHDAALRLQRQAELVQSQSAELIAIASDLSSRGHANLGDLLDSYDRTASVLAAVQAASEEVGRVDHETIGDQLKRLDAEGAALQTSLDASAALHDELDALARKNGIGEGEALVDFFSRALATAAKRTDEAVEPEPKASPEKHAAKSKAAPKT